MFNFQYSINGTIDFRGRWVKAETLHKILVQQGGLSERAGSDFGELDDAGCFVMLLYPVRDREN